MSVPTCRSADWRPGQLQQVLVNLVGNATKFTETGEVVLTVTREDPPTTATATPDTPCVLHFAVRDTGSAFR